MNIFAKIRRKLVKLRLQPIHVYCLHHVCKNFDAETMHACDWTKIDEFKEKILQMRQDGIEFISLAGAHKHLCNDWIRFHKYAVLTFDDGYASLKEILPWLEEQNISVTLFINGKYLDGKSYRNTQKERYLTRNVLFALTSPLVEIGSHGWEHVEVKALTIEEFKESLEQNVKLLCKHTRYIPFHAYAYGDYSVISDAILATMNILPVYIDGKQNYNDITAIHRELLK